jgi:hypothetical protein
VVSATDPHGRTLAFLGRTVYYISDSKCINNHEIQYDYRRRLYWYTNLLDTLIHTEHGSLVGIVTAYGLYGGGFGDRESRWGKAFSLLHIFQTGSGGPPNLLSNGYRGKATGA